MKFIKRIIQKIRDYDRLERDYCVLMDVMTCGRMSKPNYEVADVIAMANRAQWGLNSAIIADDLIGMIEGGAETDDISRYVHDMVVDRPTGKRAVLPMYKVSELIKLADKKIADINGDRMYRINEVLVSLGPSRQSLTDNGLPKVDWFWVSYMRVWIAPNVPGWKFMGITGCSSPE